MMASSLMQSLLILSLIFTPVAFGSANLWALSIMEILLVLVTFLWLAKSIFGGKLIFVDTALNLPVILFLVLAMAQYLIGRITSAKIGTVYPYATKVYFFEILSYMLAFLFVVNNVRSRREINRILLAIISTGALLAVYGIIQKLAGVTRIFWFRSVHEVLVFYSSYVNCNLFAGYMNMVIFLAQGAFFTYISYLDKVRGYRRFDILEGWNFLFMLSITLMAISIFHTFSMGGVLVFLMTSAFFYFLYLKNEVVKKRILVFTLTFTAIVAAALLVWILKDKLFGLFNKLYRLTGHINTYGLRLPIWSKTIEIVKTYPAFGSGLGTFKCLFNKYKPIINVSHSHNDYLELLLETGIIGFSIFVIGMAAFFKRYVTLLYSRKSDYSRVIGYGCLAAAFSVFLYSFVDFNMHLGANAMLFSVILGIGSVTIHNHSDGKGDESVVFKTKTFSINGWHKKLLASGGLFFCTVYILASIISVWTAYTYASHGEAMHDIKYTRKAITLEPLSSEYRYLLAYLLSDDFRDFLKADVTLSQEVIYNLKEAIRLNPKIGRYHQKLAQAYMRTGEMEKAKKELEEAKILDPYTATSYLLMAVYYFNDAMKVKGIDPSNSKAMEEGMVEYRKALSLNPSVNIGKFKSLLNDYPQIKKILKKKF